MCVQNSISAIIGLTIAVTMGNYFVGYVIKLNVPED